MTIRFSSSLTMIEDFWSDFKSKVGLKNLVTLMQFDEDAEKYTIFVLDNQLCYTSTIWKSTVPDGIYTQEQNDADKEDFLNNYLPRITKPATPRNTDAIPLVSSEPRSGTEVVYATHNFCDPTTWFHDSERITEEVATDSGDGLTWILAHQNIIDLTHGKIFDEAQYVLDQKTDNPSNPHGYAVLVEVNDEIKIEREPFASTGGDYTVNYSAGTITFDQSQAGSTVKVSYSYEAGSTFTMLPDPDYVLDIEKVKAMWSADLIMTDSIVFQIYGLAAIFAPQLGLPPGTKIPLVTTTYHTIVQLIAEALEYMPNAVPVVQGVRGIPSAQHAITFRYGTVRRLNSDYGIELRVGLKDHTPFLGSSAVSTFYCVIRPL